MVRIAEKCEASDVRSRLGPRSLIASSKSKKVSIPRNPPKSLADRLGPKVSLAKRKISESKKVPVNFELAEDRKNNCDLDLGFDELEFDTVRHNHSPSQSEKSHSRLDKSSNIYRTDGFKRSPRRFDRSPRRLDRSPRRLDRSPRRLDRRPGRFDSSPGRCDRSQGRCDRSPRRLDRSPGRFHRSPRRFDHSPRRIDHSPRRFDTSPRRFDHSPRRFDTSPRRFDTSPRRFDHSPRRFDTSPRRFDHSPRRIDHSPRRFDHSPRRFDHSPRRFDHSPRRFDTSPRRFDTSPRRFDHSPRRFDTSPLRFDYSPRQFDHHSPRRIQQSPHRFQDSPHRTSPALIDYKHNNSSHEQESYRHREMNPRFDHNLSPSRIVKKYEQNNSNEGGRTLSVDSASMKLFKTTRASLMAHMAELRTYYKEYPFAHLNYKKKWTEFYKQRKSELISQNLDIAKYDMTSEWKQVWPDKVDELIEQKFAEDVKKIYKKYDIDETTGKPIVKSEVSEIEIISEGTRTSTAKSNLHTKSIMRFLADAAASNTPKPTQVINRSSDGEKTFKYSVISTLKILNELENYLGDIAPQLSFLLFSAVKLNISGKDPLVLFKDAAQVDLIDSAYQKIVVAISKPGKGQDLISSGTVCLQSVSWLLKEIFDKLFCGINLIKFARDTVCNNWADIAKKIARTLLDTEKAGHASEDALQDILQSITKLHEIHPAPLDNSSTIETLLSTLDVEAVINIGKNVLSQQKQDTQQQKTLPLSEFAQQKLHRESPAGPSGCEKLQQQPPPPPLSFPPPQLFNYPPPTNPFPNAPETSRPPPPFPNSQFSVPPPSTSHFQQYSSAPPYNGNCAQPPHIFQQNNGLH